MHTYIRTRKYLCTAVSTPKVETLVFKKSESLFCKESITQNLKPAPETYVDDDEQSRRHSWKHAPPSRTD